MPMDLLTVIVCIQNRLLRFIIVFFNKFFFLFAINDFLDILSTHQW